MIDISAVNSDIPSDKPRATPKESGYWLPERKMVINHRRKDLRTFFSQIKLVHKTGSHALNFYINKEISN